MDTFLRRFVKKIKGYISEFDRIVFKGCIRPLMYAAGAQNFYYDHAEYGFMSVRLQTRFPYGIQIALNGREWLRRSLNKQGLGCVLHGNKFLHIDDFACARVLRYMGRPVDIDIGIIKTEVPMFGEERIVPPMMIQRIQIHIGQQRTDDAALRRSGLTVHPFPVLQHPALEHLLEVSHHSPISNPLRYARQQSFVRDRVKYRLM